MTLRKIIKIMAWIINFPYGIDGKGNLK